MAARGGSARSRTEKFQIVFAIIGLAAAMPLVLDANFIVRIVALFAGALVGAGVGFILARITGRD